MVDIWGRVDPDNGFNGDSLTNVYSSTKSITSIMMAMAQERGLLDYGDKIAKHWPEFGQAGKEDITIADLMRHEGGLASFPEPIEITDVQPENIKKNCAGAKIAKMTPSWPENGRRQYHACSRGWIANEIFRRVMPDNITLGEFLRTDLAGRLDADTHIGNTKTNYFPVRHIDGPVFGCFKKSLGLQSHMEIGITEFASLAMKLRGLVTKPDIEGMTDFTIFNKPEYRSSETSSAGGNCSARGLAKLAAMMANKVKTENLFNVYWGWFLVSASLQICGFH